MFELIKVFLNVNKTIYIDEYFHFIFLNSTSTTYLNFNINLFHPSPTENTQLPYDDKFKINYAKERKLIEMLKNKEIDSVDSKDLNDLNIKKAPRHRTLSI